jgi:ribosomal protein L34E
MEALNRERDLAEQRIELHWKRVEEKQKQCQRLNSQLQKLNSELPRLVAQQANKQSAFNRALDQLGCQKRLKQSAKDEADRSRNRYGWRGWQQASVSERMSSEAAEDALRRVTAAFNSMEAEQQNTLGAVKQKEDEIGAVKSELSNAMKPPPPVYQPLPDCRTTDFNALAVLFYMERDATSSMLILQQFCCAAQLAVCPWPLKCAGLWDVEKALSASTLSTPWMEYFHSKTEQCCYLTSLHAVAAGSGSSNLDMFAAFQEPSVTEVRSLVHSRNCATSMIAVFER